MASIKALEIGPGRRPINAEWDTLDVVLRKGITLRASWGMEPLPIEDDTYQCVFSSHALEHIVWYQVKGALAEVFRILRPGGNVELWVPDALKIAQGIIDTEAGLPVAHDRYWRMVEGKDRIGWANARLYSYGDKTGGPSENWHRGCFTPKYLERLLRRVGFDSVREMQQSERRGRSHGWIEFGMTAQKPE